MPTALRNSVGLEPLRDVLSNLSVRYWPLLDVYGEEYNAPRILLRLLLRLRLDVFVSLRVQRSLRNRSHFVLNIDSPRFGLPEGLLRFEYAAKASVLDHYHDFIVLVARFFRTDVRLSTVGREIVEFEENLAMTVEAVYSEKSFLWSGVVTEHAALNDTVMTPFTEIIAKVTERVTGGHRAAPEVVLWSKEYLQYLSHLFHQPVIWRHLINYMTWRVILELGPYTSQLFLDIRQEFLRRIGLASNAPRAEHCLHDLLATLPHAVGWLLRNESTSLRSAQKQVERMCEELKATMAHNLDYNEWMTLSTRQHAISKVQRIKFVVGEQNEALVEDTEYQDTYVILVVKLMVSEAEREWQKLTWNRPEFINDVPYSSLQVNYDPIYNTVIVPGAMLEPPLYTDGLSPALNFGSLGFLIASKMMSSLIFEGRCFDQNGTYMCWWDSSTIRNYSDTVESCYNSLFKPVNKTEINTFRKEVVTSMAAVGLAYKGFRLFMRKFEEEFEHSGLKNLDLTQNQLFFISFAMTWCESVPSRLREIVNLVTSLPDPQYRVEIALTHFDKFGKYFACNDNLVIYQDKKCSII
ncbi:membrane metallo-endopeptidase-like 1 [Amblyomma americanum]